MIVFETQEEFERAVMQIIEKRIGVNIRLKMKLTGTATVQVR